MHRQLLILLSFVPFIHSCFTTNRCQCDRVQYIDQAGIQKLEYGSYLANRTTTRPNVTVTDSCQILVDVSKLDTDNHFLMVFRDGAPPIFAKRLSDSTDKLIKLTDITCVQVGKEFEWQYYNGKVEDLSVAVQSNEEMCGCKEFSLYGTTTNYTVDPILCDYFVQICSNKGESLNLSYGNYEAMRSQNDTAIIEDLTCVSGSWYYNSLLIDNPMFYCTDRPPKFYCGCSVFRQLGVDDLILSVYTFDPEGRFANYTMRNGSATYDESECTVEIKCSDTSTLVISSLNYKPMIYPPGTKPNIMCAYSPLKSSLLSPKYWFVDGIMLSEAYFACYEPSKCPCPFAFLASNYYQYYLESSPLVSNFTENLPIWPYSIYNPLENGDCADKIECFGTLPNIFDTQTFVKFNTSSVNVSCSATTKNWTIEGIQFDQLNVFCKSRYL